MGANRSVFPKKDHLLTQRYAQHQDEDVEPEQPASPPPRHKQQQQPLFAGVTSATAESLFPVANIGSQSESLTEIKSTSQRLASIEKIASVPHLTPTNRYKVPTFASFSMNKPRINTPPAPPAPPSEPVLPQPGRRPRAMDFFDSPASNVQSTPSSTPSTQTQLVPSHVKPAGLGSVTRTTIVDYVDDSDSDSSDSSSSSSDKHKHKKKKSKKEKSRTKEKQKEKKSKHKSKHKDKSETKNSSSKKKSCRRERDAEGDAADFDAKRRKLIESEDPMQSASARNKLKMLELDMRNITEDPRALQPYNTGASSSVVATGPSEKGWFEDTIGDRNNLQFGLYRGDVPSFYRAKRVLGLPEYKVAKWPSKDVSTFRLYDLRYESLGGSGGNKTTSSGAATVEASHVERYYYLGTRRELLENEKKKKMASISTHNPTNTTTTSSSAAKFDPHSDRVDLAADEDDDDSTTQEESFEEFLSRRTKFFNENTRNDRSNIKLWREFAELQEDYAHLGAPRASILEKKIDIYKRALEFNPAADQLVLDLMKCCEQLYPTERTQRIWQETIARNPDSALLWRSYMAFVQSNFSSFTISLMRNIYTAGIKALNRQKRMYGVGIPKHRTLEERALALAIRAIYIERQSGYHERATCMFQALIEFNLCFPQKLLQTNPPRETILSFFQAFWNAEVPRFGEAGARGWNTWQAEAESRVRNDVTEIIQDYDPSKATIDEDEERERELAELRKLAADTGSATGRRETAPLPASSASSVPAVQSENAEFVAWLEDEDEADSFKWLPQRASTEDNNEDEVDEDPDRVVLFEDLKEFLFQVAYADLKREIVLRFLEFLGLKWPLSSAKASGDLESIESLENQLEEVGDMFALLEKAKFPPQCSQRDLDLDEPLTTTSLDLSNTIPIFYRSTEDNDFIQNSRLTPQRKCLIRNSLSQCLSIFDQMASTDPEAKKFKSEVHIVSLLFEGRAATSAPELQIARQTAKSLLKADSANLRLWNSYAKMEYLLGHFKESKKVYETALANLAKLPVQSLASAPALVRSYVEMLLFDITSGEDSVLAHETLSGILNVLGTLILLLVPEPERPGEPREMQCRRAFQKLIESTKKSDSFQVENFCDVAICFGLFEYTSALKATTTPAAASTKMQIQVKMEDFMEKISAAFDSGLRILFMKREHAAYHERLTCSKVLVLLRATFSRQNGVPLRASWLHDALEIGLKRYASNRFLLSAFVLVEQRNQLLGRQRLFFDQLLILPTSSVVTWLFAFRCETKQGSGNRIRALFERAITSNDKKHSPAIWKYYIDFELSQQKSGASAKGVFFRAIRSVPWNKSVWLYSLRRFANLMTLTELSDIFSLMADKELRMRSTPPL